ncbi:MAG TPA: hypothetical protein VKU41_24140 [Polyangiaceae bacterium]|nr:hypothetical protein [Polyangiaceae bacterium]
MSRSVAVEKPTSVLMSRSIAVEEPTSGLVSRSIAVEKRTSVLMSRSIAVEKRTGELMSRSIAVEKRTSAFVSLSVAIEWLPARVGSPSFATVGRRTAPASVWTAVDDLQVSSDRGRAPVHAATRACRGPPADVRGRALGAARPRWEPDRRGHADRRADP